MIEMFSFLLIAFLIVLAVVIWIFAKDPYGKKYARKQEEIKRLMESSD